MTTDGYTIKTSDDLSDERFAATLATMMPDGSVSMAALLAASAAELRANAVSLGVGR